MSSQFPKIPSIIEKNHFCGEDFDVMKRNAMDNVFGADKVEKILINCFSSYVSECFLIESIQIRI